MSGKMNPLDPLELRRIAEAYGIEYDAPPSPFNRRAVISRMARNFQVPQKKLYNLIADVGAHVRFFPHLRALNVIKSKQLANVIAENQVVVVEGLAEGGSKLGVKLFTFFPTDRIEGELMTDPFVSGAPHLMHNKSGSILWHFQAVGPSTTRMRVESDFTVGPNSAYVRGTVDHVWLDFFENLMVHFGEMAKSQKLCSPFGKRPSHANRKTKLRGK